MIINTIKIKNISSFKGEHAFHFNHTHSATIALILGENGAGKSSIMQALKLGLYGQFLFNNKNSYQAYLDNFIRRNESIASVELHFKLQTLPGIENYIIRRNWQRSTGSIKEALSVIKDNESFEDVTPQFYQEFIFSILPIGMMDLFFFDGEKINNLGEALSSGEMSSAVKKLIGISALDKLEEAIVKNQMEAMRGAPGHGALEKEIKALEVELFKLHEEGESLHQRYAETNETIKKNQKLLANKEISFFETGGNLASSREVLKERRVVLQQRLEETQNQIQESSQEYLPLCVLSEELKELAEQILVERDDAAKLIIKEYTQQKKQQIKHALIEREASDDIIKTTLELLSVSSGTAQQPIHGLSAKQADEILGIIRTVNDAIRPRALEAFTTLDLIRHELNVIESALEKIPDSSELVEALSEMKDINVRLAKLEKSLEDILAQKRRLESDVHALENKKHILLQKVDKQDTAKKSDELVAKFPQVLKKIKTDLLERRMQSLQQLILHNLQLLFRKNKLIQNVRISSDFSFELVGKDSAVIDLKHLSAGEQQMLATSTQWALATLASENIPTVIDTPLARLDSHHRKKLVQDYYPMMKQLILLSTDEEINGALLEQLTPCISDIYSLKYNKDEECTETAKVN